MGWTRDGLIILMLLCSSFAAVVEVGDWTTEAVGWNVDDAAAARCGQAGVQAVYICSGDVVKAISPDGSTFYKPEGKTVSCPNVAPSQMGAECMQMLTPNYCPVQADCASKTTETPSGNVTNSSGKTQVTNISSPPAPASTPVKASAKPMAEDKANIVIPAAAPSSFEFSMDSLAIVVLLLGAVSVGVLFTMFKNSISE